MVSMYRYIWDADYNSRFQQILAPVTREEREYDEALKQAADLVPADAAVSTDLMGLPYLCHRFYVYDFPFNTDKAEYLLIDTMQVVLSPKLASEEDREAAVRKVFSGGEWQLVGQRKGIVVLKRQGAR
jgi:hypothetical protein